MNEHTQYENETHEQTTKRLFAWFGSNNTPQKKAQRQKELNDTLVRMRVADKPLFDIGDIILDVGSHSVPEIIKSCTFCHVSKDWLYTLAKYHTPSNTMSSATSVAQQWMLKNAKVMGHDDSFCEF